MDLCFRYCRVVVKKDCSRTKPSALWAEDNKCKLPNPPQLPWTDMRYSMFQKVIHRSGLPGCADIIVLAEVGLPTLIRHHPPPWKYRQKQADDKIFHSFVCAAEIPCPQSNVRKLKKKKKTVEKSPFDLILSVPSFIHHDSNLQQIPATDVLRPVFEWGASSGFSNVSRFLHEDCPLGYDLSSLIRSSSSGL